MFTSTLLYLNLSNLIIKLKLKPDLDLFAKQMSINKDFLEPNLSYS